MSAAAQAVSSPPKGMKVKNTFIDIDDASDEEVGFAQRSRRGLLTMPEMPEKGLACEDQPFPEPSPVAAKDAADAAEQPSPSGHPVLLGALQRKATADLPDQKVIIKNTFIEEPDASPVSPGPGRRVTCPVLWPSMEQAERLTAFGMQAGDDASEDESHGRHPSGGGSSSGPCEAAASSDDDDVPQTPRQRWSMQTEDLQAEALAAALRPQAGRAQAPRGSGASAGRRVSFPKEEIARQSNEDSDSDTPRRPRRGGAFDTQDLRECLMQGSMPELEAEVHSPGSAAASAGVERGAEAGSARQPQTPIRVPVSLLSAAVAGVPPPPSPATPCPQAFQSPGQPATQPGIFLSLSNAVDAAAPCMGPAPPPLLPMNPPSPAAVPTMGVPVSISLAVNDAGTGGSPTRATAGVYYPTSPTAAAAAAAAAQLGSPLPPSPGQSYGSSPAGASWASVSPYGYPCAVQMPWSSPWPWCAMPAEQAQPQGHEQPPFGAAGAQPVGARPERAERREAARQPTPAAAAAADEAAAAASGQPGAAGGTSTAPSARSGRRLRLWAHIYLHMQVPGFDLVPRLIGRGGCNMRKIAEATGAKIRIRGRGSGHLEIEGRAEAPTPLMVAVTTDKLDETGFRSAIELVVKELRCTEQRFRVFCQKQNIKHEGPCYSIGLLPDEARKCLGAIVDGIPMSSGAKKSEA